jgi:tetratricopeptide (TPR) repeat protein
MKKIFACLVVVVASFLLLTASVTYATDEFELYIAQGIEKINSGNFREAVELLKKSLELRPDNPEAEFYSGVAYSRVGELSRAEKMFQKIKTEEVYASNVYLELGRIYYAWKECKRTDKYLTIFKALADDDVQKGYADAMIERCYEQEDAEKPYKLNLTTGVQYDTNVILESTNPVTDEELRGDDGRAVVLINAGARVFKNRDVTAKVDYNFYQSFHFDLTRFNVHYHSIEPTIELTQSDIIRPSTGYKFEYVYFDNDTYGFSHKWFTKVNLKESEHYSIDGIYEFKENHYRDTETYTTNSDRKGHQHIYGIKQNFERDKTKGDIHYYYDRNNAKEDEWSYSGDNVGAVVGYRLMEPLVIQVSADFTRRKHKEEYPLFDEKRIDEMQRYSFKIHYSVTDRIVATLSESYTRNDSNLADYDYRRNIIGLLLTYGVL